MARATTEAQVYNVIKNNGAITRSKQPSDAQLRLYAHLVIANGMRFEVPDASWAGRTKWQMCCMIETAQQQSESA